MADVLCQPRLAAEATVLEAEVALADDDFERARVLAAEVLGSPEAGPEAVCRSHALIGRIDRVGDLGAARRAFERALAVADVAGLPLWRLHALHELGTIEIFDHVGVARITQARDAASELGALSTLAVIDLQLAITDTWRLELDQGAEHARLASDMAGRLGLGEVWTKAQFSLAENCAARGQRDEMERFLALLASDSPGERYLEGFAWGCRGMAELLQGDWPGALRLFERGTALLAVLPPAEPSQFRAWWPLLLAVTGDERAADECAEARAGGVAVPRTNRGLLGYADAIIAGRACRADLAARLAEQAGADLGVLQVWPHLARLCAVEPALADGWGQPRQWLAAALACFAARGLDGLAARCRDLLDLAEPGRRTWLASLGITAREADVLDLVAQGLSNKDIASRLFLSPRTVEKHVESLLRKTGARSRTQLAVSGTQVRAR